MVNLENKKTLVIITLIMLALTFIIRPVYSNMYDRSEQLEKTVNNLKTNQNNSEYILVSDATKNNIPYIKRSETIINGKKYCKYSNHYELYATALFVFRLFILIYSVLCVAKLAIISGREMREIGKKTIDIEKK